MGHSRSESSPAYESGGDASAPSSPFSGPWPEAADVVAVGGSLEPDLVLDAYVHGVFPFYGADQPTLWWCPDPRTVIPLGAFHVPRRLARTIGTRDYEVRVDTSFEAVVRACDEGRPDGSWIHEDMVRCYVELHRRGHAHALEVWRGPRLVGGLYGVTVGGCFAAESMFHRERDMSKVALAHLVGRLRVRGFTLLDVQFLTPHLARFGAVEIPRTRYLGRLAAVRADPVTFA